MPDFTGLEQQYGLPSGLLSAVMQQESGGNVNAVSPVGAQGPFQFMPATAQQYGVTNPYDLNQAAQGAAAMYGDLSKKYNGDVPSMLAGYNWGQGNVDRKGLNSAPPETVNYVNSIMGKLGSNQGIQYAQDSGTQTDAQTSNSLSLQDIRQKYPQYNDLSDQQLADSLHQKFYSDIPQQDFYNKIGLQSIKASTPSIFLNGTSQPDFSQREDSDISKRTQNINDIALRGLSNQEPIPNAALGVLGQGAGLALDTAGNAIGSVARGVLPDSVRQAGSDALNWLANSQTGRAVGTANNLYDQLPAGIKDPLSAGANIAGATTAGNAIGSVANMAKDSAPTIANFVKNTLPPNFMADESSMGGPFSNLMKKAAQGAAPAIDKNTAQIVQDASDLGINVPTKDFAGGNTSAALNKVGLLSGDDTKAQVTTALSQAMGHEGTNTLDVNTMSRIKDNIVDKMNDFALKADESGGIPVAEKDLTDITANSYADESKLKKLVQKIKDRLNPNGTLAGEDYQALTKKGGALDKAMNSSDSDFADTASELREHLDGALEKTVSPEDLATFKEARRQYRTMKIVQPIVESGGVTGQAESASKLFNAVVKNYGSIENAIKYNPALGKIAQIVNEFPTILQGAPEKGLLAKFAKIGGAGGLATGAGFVGGAPAAAAIGATIPAAYGAGKYLSSPFYKGAILEKSLKVGKK